MDFVKTVILEHDLSMEIEVRQSKLIVLLCILSLCLFEVLWSYAIIAPLLDLLKNEYARIDDLVGDIYLVCFGSIMFIAFAILMIYLFYNYKVQIDVYAEDKMYRKKKNKIIFELEYKEIVSIREGILSTIYLFCNKPIIKCNGKKGPRTFNEHYHRKDIKCIKKIILTKYPNINIG